MTVAEIANVAQVSQRTVRRVVSDLFPTKMQHGRRATFSREEATAIMAELRKPGFVVPNSGKTPDQSGKTPEPRQPPLSGALLRELRLAVAAGTISKAEERRLLGLDGHDGFTAFRPLPTLPAPEIPAELAFRAAAHGITLPETAIERAARTAAAAAGAVIRRELDRAVADAMQGRLL